MAKREMRLSDRVDFGQFKGKTISEVIKIQPDYVAWMWYKLGIEMHKAVWDAIKRARS